LKIRPIDILGTGIVLAIVGAILIGLNLSPKYDFLPYESYWDSVNSVEPNSTKRVSFGFVSKGHVLVAKISVLDSGGWSNGGKPSQILAEIQDSSGNTILSSALVDGNYSFPFEASKNDTYYFNFDNTNSSVGASSDERKWVLWQIWYYGNYGNYPLVLQFFASAFWTSGILCIGLYLFKRKEGGSGAESIPRLAKEIIEKIIKRK